VNPGIDVRPPGQRASATPVRVAVIGAGWMGQVHANCLAASGRAEVAAVVDPSQRSREDFVARFPGAVPYAGVEEMLAGSDASLVTVCAPSGLHAELALPCLREGRHVVVEKPLATTVADGEAMGAAAAAGGATLSVILQYRFTRDALRLKRAVDAGLFGTLLFANVSNLISRDTEYFEASGGWRGTWELNGGGVLINQTTHGMDLLHWCMGPVASVSGTAATRRHRVEVEDTLDASLTFPGGAMGHVQATSAASANRPLRLEIIGTEGAAVFERSRLTRWEPSRDVELLSAAEKELMPPAPDDVFGEPFGTAHERQYRAVLDALEDGSTPPVPAAEALGSLRTISQVYAAVDGPAAKPASVSAAAIAAAGPAMVAAGVNGAL